MKTFTIKEIGVGFGFSDDYRKSIIRKRFKVLGHSVNYHGIINVSNHSIPVQIFRAKGK